jgi:hypothetical protein
MTTAEARLPAATSTATARDVDGDRAQSILGAGEIDVRHAAHAPPRHVDDLGTAVVQRRSLESSATRSRSDTTPWGGSPGTRDTSRWLTPGSLSACIASLAVAEGSM